MREIKLFFVNYNSTVERFGEDKQKEVHQQFFKIVLDNYINGYIAKHVVIPEIGSLKFIESEINDDDTHLVIKYFLRAV